VNASNIILGIGLIIGSILSYGPQYYSIWRRKSTEGLNIGTIALGVWASSCILMNFLYLKWGVKHACCSQDGFGKCLAHTLDGQQIAVTAACVVVWCVMWLWYFKVDESPEVIRPLEELQQRERLKRLVRLGVAGTMGFVVFNIVLAGLLNVVWKAGAVASWIGFLLGILGTICVVVQWAPQIWTTWKLQAVGSLSILMLIIQLPGTLLVIYFQGVLNKAHWSTLLPYAVTAAEFTILIGLCGFFMTRDWWRIRSAAQLAEQHPDYAFTHLDDNIQTKRITLAEPTNSDEAEAEAMMNLEFDEDGDFPSSSPSNSLLSHHSSHEDTSRFTYKPETTSKPPSLAQNMTEVQTLLQSLREPPSSTNTDSNVVSLEEDDEDPW
jgi:uncharacterized protein with PQ loop repeat